MVSYYEGIKKIGKRKKSYYISKSEGIFCNSFYRHSGNIPLDLQIFEDIDEVSVKMEDTYYDEHSTIMEVSVLFAITRL